MEPLNWPKRIDYAALEKVEAVESFFGMKIVVTSDIPDGEIHIVQHGRLAGKIIVQPSLPTER